MRRTFGGGFNPASTITASLREQSPLCSRQFFCIIATREEVAVDVHRHYNRGMAEPFLNDLRRQAQATIGNAIDAPRGKEVPQAVHPSIARLHDRLPFIVPLASVDDDGQRFPTMFSPAFHSMVRIVPHGVV
jgi:hypothetical protein